MICLVSIDAHPAQRQQQRVSSGQIVFVVIIFVVGAIISCCSAFCRLRLCLLWKLGGISWTMLPFEFCNITSAVNWHVDVAVAYSAYTSDTSPSMSLAESMSRDNAVASVSVNVHVLPVEYYHVKRMTTFANQ